ncbi:MAG TPA: hypothetical protein VFS43_25225 [Polyangiaceae bacterium]|nr:hypothetical protein [Polyangiaceae bacterium]
MSATSRYLRPALGIAALAWNAFAVGTFGGLAGCLLLLLRRRVATPVLAASLAGYVLLFAGDVTEGVFAALGAPQVATLSAVVAIAAALFAWSRRLERRGAFAR